MTRPHRLTPPLSPVLLAGLAMRPLPPVLLQPALDAAMHAIRRRHPGVFERLSGLDAPLFLIDPTDLPFMFLLHADAEAPRLSAVSGGEGAMIAEEEATATIRGPLMTLIELMEGRLDGDALFFSRELVVEGETEAVVALRNAVDGAEIDVLSDVLSVLGPLAAPARRLADGAGFLFSRFADDLETLRSAVIAPAMRRTDAQAAKLRDIDEKLAASRRRPTRTQKDTTETP